MLDRDVGDCNSTNAKDIQTRLIDLAACKGELIERHLVGPNGELNE